MSLSTTQEQNGITHESNFISLIGNDLITIYGGKKPQSSATYVAAKIVGRAQPFSRGPTVGMAQARRAILGPPP